MKGFCSIANCAKPSRPWHLHDRKISAFCDRHSEEFGFSAEAQRVQRHIHLPDVEEPCHMLISALADFRTRLELEWTRDCDPQVIAARGGA